MLELLIVFGSLTLIFVIAAIVDWVEKFENKDAFDRQRDKMIAAQNLAQYNEGQIKQLRARAELAENLQNYWRECFVTVTTKSVTQKVRQFQSTQAKRKKHGK